ncbi:MAG: DUF1573 domain-containing protein [Salinivirgaceae bacterium]|nr:DUF1573 domain-containing protein [Salinivirgaceae bacterium]MDD4747181.1 DUF1573 domain-containing protein [Salinivirgaceae bacterium]MDY0281805.1 DUF1573 domain-containing protein [Salinivirgaceae bacterium]
MKKIVIYLLLSLLVGTAMSQQDGPNIVFENLTHNFDAINEEGGKVDCKFVFTNTGSQPLVITRVQATCGCTTSDYTRQPVLSGQKGFIQVVYDPIHRPGPFAKTINVYSNAIVPTTVLTIRGNVTPKPRTIEDDYPRLIETVRMKNNQFSFLNVKHTETVQKEIEIINVGDKPTTIELDNVPTYLSINVTPKTLQPNEKGLMIATLNANDLNDFGFLVHRMYLKINGVRPQNSMISATAVIKEDFSHLTQKELEIAPVIEFEKTDHDFGTTKAGTVESHEYKFKNTGKTPLVIRKVRTGCGCTASTPPTESIQPGASSSIVVTFNSRGRKGRQAQYIDVYCNDPKKSEVKLKIGGIVEEAKE